MAAKIFVALVLTGALAGCATTANYEKALSRWEGVHMDELVKSWGPPRHVRPLTGGGQELEYVLEQTWTPGGWSAPRRSAPLTNGSSASPTQGELFYGREVSPSSPPTGGPAPARRSGAEQEMVLSRCITRFAVDAQGVVRSWSWEGDSCVALGSAR